MTIRPSGKAGKRTQSVKVRQTPEQMAAVVIAEVEKVQHARKTWLDNLEASARRIIDAADKMPAADVEAARGIVHYAGRLREHGGPHDDAHFDAFQIGRALERIKDSPLVEIARLETKNYMLWRGTGVRLTEREKAICDFIGDRPSVDLADLYRTCWGGTYNRHWYSDKVRRAFSTLSAKFLANGIRVQLNIRDGRVIMTEA